MALPEASFIWGANGAKLTPEEIAMQRAILARKGGIDTSPVGHWAQGAARVADAISGAFQRGRLDTAADENTKYDAELAAPLAEALAGGVVAYPASVAAGGGSMADAAVGLGGPSEYRDAIASIESKGSGDYSAIGPTHPTMGQALGRYQIMEANLGPWGQEAIGRPVTKEEFLANPKIQDALFDTKFGGYVKQFGPAGAAQAWFAGPGGVGKTGRKDSLGTSVGVYGDKFLAALNRRQAATPVQTASIDTDPPRAPLIAPPVDPAVAQNIPVQVASLEPGAGMAAYAPQAAVPPAAAAIEAVAPQGISRTGQPMLIDDVNGQRMGVIEQQAALGATPYTGPGAQTGQPMLVDDVNGVRMAANYGMPGAEPGVPMANPPATVDMTNVGSLSAGAGIPFVQPNGAPTATPISGQARVAQALQAYPMRAQAAAGDQMVAGADQTLQPTTMATQNAKGLLEPGNIDLASRPVVKNSDGSISTVRSMSFNEDGKEILVPTVSPDGRILSNDEAINLYHQTGQNLGKFNSPQAATEYAQVLHNQQSQAYAPQQQAVGGGQQPQAQGNPIAAAVRAISDPRASPQTKAIAELVIKQAQARQAAVAEQQVWQQRKEYEAQQQANDPKRQLEIQKLQREVNAPAKRETITVNGTVLDAQTMQPVYTAPDKPTADIQEYEDYAKREQAAGREPLGPLQYRQELRKAGASNTTVSVGGNGSKFIEESDKLAATRLSDVVTAAANSPQIISDLGTLTELGKTIGTGKGAEVLQQLGPYAEAFGIKIEGLSEGQAFDSIVQRMAPAMRIPGSGAQSDVELLGFLRSLPRISNQPGGNELIAKTFQAVQERKLQAAEIAAQAQSQQITWQEAEKRIRELPGGDPWSDFKKFKNDLDDPKKVPTAVPGVTIRKIGD